MSTTIKVSELSPEHIESVYSGKPGCACGCRGNHSKSEASIRTILRNMRANQAEKKIEDNLDNTGKIVSTETETRLYIAYLKPGVEVSA